MLPIEEKNVSLMNCSELKEWMLQALSSHRWTPSIQDQCPSEKPLEESKNLKENHFKSKS